MVTIFATVPWNTPALWREINAGFEHLLQRGGEGIDESRRLGRQASRQLRTLFPVMDRLCRQTCAICTDTCCRHAWIWFDFRDLLFLHLTGEGPPEGQPIRRRGERCRFLGPHGCRLERMQRPFVCTWYLCPVQMRRLRETPVCMGSTQAGIQRLKQLRRQMEQAFIRWMG